MDSSDRQRAAADDSSLVSIIVVTWNGRDFLKRCLTAVAAQTHPRIKAIVVDNGSSDGTLVMLRADFPSVLVIENQDNLGFAAANVQALPYCAGRYIALLNNDAAPDPDWLAHLVQALDDDPSAAGACGTVVDWDDPTRVIFTTPKVDAWSGRAIWVNQAAPACDVNSLSGNSMLMRRSAIDHIGFLDPNYLAYYEETDWCARALRAGYRLRYAPAAVVAHREQGSASSDYHAYFLARNQLRFVVKNVDAERLGPAVLLALITVMADAGRALRAGRTRSFWACFRGILWNIAHGGQTFRARRHDLDRLGPSAASYSRRLPLRAHRSDGRGGLTPPIGA